MAMKILVNLNCNTIGRRRDLLLWKIVALTFSLLSVVSNLSCVSLITINDISSDYPTRERKREEEVGIGSTTTTTTINNSLIRRFFFYPRNPFQFTDAIADCIIDPQCSIMYYHVQKTGGTYVSSTLHNTLNNADNDLINFNNSTTTTTNTNGGSSKVNWCCHDDVMKHFRKRYQTEFCPKKFVSYEVQPYQFKEVLQTCSRNIEFYHHHHHSTTTNKAGIADRTKTTTPTLQPSPPPPPTTTTTTRRYLGLISIREPIQRTLSQIHHICSQPRKYMNQQARIACQECNYHSSKGKPFFDGRVDETNTIYQGIQQLILSHDEDDDENQNIPLLILDNNHIDEALVGIAKEVTSKMRQQRRRRQQQSTPMHSITTTTATTTTTTTRGNNNNGTRIEEDDDDETIATTPFQFVKGDANKEKPKILCDFGMNSEMMKNLDISFDVYHWLWSQSSFSSSLLY